MRDGNYKNRGELFLEHQHNGVELQMNYARDTLANLHRLWTPAGAHRNHARRQTNHVFVRRQRTQNRDRQVKIIDNVTLNRTRHQN